MFKIKGDSRDDDEYVTAGRFYPSIHAWIVAASLQYQPERVTFAQVKAIALLLVPGGEVYSLEELFAQLIEQQQLLAYEVKERFYQIGSIDGIEEFKKYIFRSGGKG